MEFLLGIIFNVIFLIYSANEADKHNITNKQFFIGNIIIFIAIWTCVILVYEGTHTNDEKCIKKTYIDSSEVYMHTEVNICDNSLYLSFRIKDKK